MPLTELNCGGTKVFDLSPLKQMRLTTLTCYSTQVSNLLPLEGMPLTKLDCYNTPVSDLSPLVSVTTLQLLNLKGTKVTADGVAVLQKALPNCSIVWSAEGNNRPLQPAAPGQPISTFNGLALQAWAKTVTTLPAETQVEVVAKKLMELNPGFDGKVTGFNRNTSPQIVGGVVTAFGFITDNVTDISPVRALVGLKVLNCYRTNDGTSKLSDLSPLRGMVLNNMGCGGTKVADLSPLRGMPLAELYCGNTQVSDLSPLQGMQLTNLECSHTSVSDLSPLRGMPLKTLWLGVTQVADLSPLTGMRLTVLACDSTKVSDLSPLQGMPLTKLLVMNTGVSDLSPLEDCKSLESLNIKNTKVTPAGVAALQKALPNCKIDWNDPAKPAASGSK